MKKIRIEIDEKYYCFDMYGCSLIISTSLSSSTIHVQNFKLFKKKRKGSTVEFDMEILDYNMEVYYMANLGKFDLHVYEGNVVGIFYFVEEKNYYEAIIKGYNFKTNSWDQFFFDL